MISAQQLLLRIQLGVIASYFLMKFLVRSFVLEQGYTGFAKIVVMSYPNFCEAVAASIFVTFLLLIINNRFIKKGLLLKEKYIPLLAVLITGIYVVLQEFKIHNLGGENTYDPYDVVFSIIGLITAVIILLVFKPKVL